MRLRPEAQTEVCATHWLRGNDLRATLARAGTREDIDPADFSDERRCIPTAPSSLTSVPDDKLLIVNSSETANLHFF